MLLGETEQWRIFALEGDVPIERGYTWARRFAFCTIPALLQKSLSPARFGSESSPCAHTGTEQRARLKSAFDEIKSEL